MKCAVCEGEFSGETAIIGEPLGLVGGYRDDYLLLVTCPHCQGTHSIRMWQSEGSALEDELESTLEEMHEIRRTAPSFEPSLFERSALAN